MTSLPENKQPKRRSAVQVMGKLIGLVKPLIHIMLAAIILGTVGYLCAIFLTIFAGKAVVTVMQGHSVKRIMTIMVVIAVSRGILHYVEQYCNHFIAFKLLAIIRHKVFAALRRLCPAKLEGRDKGNLISIITTDIELLEVFYAHTISPIAIAILTSLIMVVFIGRYHVYAGILACAAYIVVGLIIPLCNGRRGGDDGMGFRSGFGELNSHVLDSLHGLDETIQYGYGDVRKSQMTDKAGKLAGIQRRLNGAEGTQRAVTNMVILLASFGMLALTLGLYQKEMLDIEGVIVCTVAMMGSFGPVVALASLSNNLNQTLASGERVLSLLAEEPVVEEIPDRTVKEMKPEKISGGEQKSVPQKTVDVGTEAANGNVYENTSLNSNNKAYSAEARHITFSYDGQQNILDDYSAEFAPGKITGIHGPSGCGKSTLLKLLMRFWKTDKGDVMVAGRDVDEIPTTALRDMESYVTQETHLFHDSIAANIAIGKPGASMDEIVEAAKKASIHEFIISLPQGYDTQVGELGDTLSGGEKQRIGIARAFLHDSPIILMDEPTSNLDSLNEGIILRSLSEEAEEKTVILVSHRASTMSVCDVVYDV